MTEYLLSFEREVRASSADLFGGWTSDDMLIKWFTPKPWTTSFAHMDLRHGGAFATTMEGPDGEKIEGEGCVLDYVLDRKLVWTNMMRADFVPNVMPEGAFGFVATLEFEPLGAGALYRASARHADEAGMKAHEAMGFEAGWNAALDQLLELIG